MKTSIPSTVVGIAVGAAIAWTLSVFCLGVWALGHLSQKCTYHGRKIA